VQKVSYRIAEMDCINHHADQLLLLARFESKKKALLTGPVDLPEITSQVLVRHQQQIIDKGLTVNFETDGEYTVYSDPYLVEIVLDNIISNAVKYSPGPGNISIGIARTTHIQVASHNAHLERPSMRRYSHAALIAALSNRV